MDPIKLLRRGFAVAWALILAYVLICGILIAIGLVSGNMPEGGVFFPAPGYPAVTPPFLMLTIAAILLLLQSIWSIPLRTDGSVLTHRLLHAIITFPLFFLALGSYAWLEGSLGEAAADMFLTTTSAIYVAASALFGIRWFLELIHLVPKKWRTPNAY